MANSSFTVVRADNGKATFTYDSDTTDQVAAITAEGFWDDATPWASKNYELVFHIKSNSTPPSLSLRLLDVESRTGILIHNGRSPNASTGCLIAPQDFINQIYADYQSRGLSTDPGKSAGTISVSGDFGAKLSIEALTPSVMEGDPIKLKISLAGVGATNGLSKDLYVQVTSLTGFGKEGIDLAAIDSLPSTVAVNGNPGYVKIPKGQTSVILEIPTFLDNNDTGSEIPGEIVDFVISDYRIYNPGTTVAKDKYYQDEAFILNKNFSDVNVTIRNKPNVLDKNIQASGGNEGYLNTDQFSPGQQIQIKFDPYTIPDRFTISDSAGTTLLDTGFIGNGNIYTSNFIVPSQGDGLLTIRVLTNDPGTAWEFSVTSVRAMAAVVSTLSAASGSRNAANGSELLSKLSASAVSPLEVLRAKAEELEGDNVEQSFGFSVKLHDTSLNGKTIDWEFQGAGSNPAGAADFATDVPLSGSFTIPVNAQLGKEIVYFELPRTLSDAISEGIETFVVLFKDRTTGEYLTDGDGNPVKVEFSIVDQYTLSTVKDGTAGDDDLQSNDPSAVIRGLAGDDNILGTPGVDYLDGGAGADSIKAFEGDDTIIGGFGNDAIDGGSGFDTVLINSLMANVTIEKNSNGSYTITDLSSVSYGTDNLVNVERVQFADGIFDLDRSPVTFNNIRGTNLVDTLMGGDGADKIIGLGGNDKIFGLANDDQLFGYDGSDYLSGGDGNDFLRGGNGNDALYGGAGNDILIGESGKNRLFGDGGSDRLVAGDDGDVLNGGDDNDVLIGGLGNDYGYGGSGNDYLDGGAGQDVLYGDDGADRLVGGVSNDRLFGGGGNDILQGQDGNDVLNGGSGRDVLSGGAGSDQFVFNAISDSSSGSTSRDFIADWNVGDRIDFRAIDANTSVADDGINQAFAYIGSSAFQQAGQLRSFTTSNGNTIIQGNTDADVTTVEIEIELAGVVSFTRGSGLLL